jgi:hypothetical protein
MSAPTVRALSLQQDRSAVPVPSASGAQSRSLDSLAVPVDARAGGVSYPYREGQTNENKLDESERMIQYVQRYVVYLSNA